MCLSIPFLGCKYSLLTSPELMESENLIFKDLENISYVPPLDDYKWYDEIDFGDSIPLVSTKARIAGKKDAVQISNKFAETMQKEGRKSSKLAKIHLFHHFVDNIINCGCADNVFVELVNTICNHI